MDINKNDTVISDTGLETVFECDSETDSESDKKDNKINATDVMDVLDEQSIKITVTDNFGKINNTYPNCL